MFFPEIVSMHFQLTGRCNLKCVFCGQQNGMFSGSHREELPYEKWISLAEEMRNHGSRPEIILWGGEPLLYPRFDELAEHLRRMGFELGIVTNGTLADRHADILNNDFKTIYISLDGNAEYHNRIRGKGVFEKVKGIWSFSALSRTKTPPPRLKLPLFSRNSVPIKSFFSGSCTFPHRKSRSTGSG